MNSAHPNVSAESAGPETARPYARQAVDVVATLGSDPSNGLTSAEAASRLASHGPNRIAEEKPPSVLVVALSQLGDPMNLMLVAVTVVSFLIGQVSTGVIVCLLIVLNVVLGSRQEMKAKASVDALSNLQVPQAEQRPELYVFGLSLGSYAAESAFSGEADMANRTDGILLAGPPAFNSLNREFTDDRDPGTPEVQPVFGNGRTVRFANDPAAGIPLEGATE